MTKRKHQATRINKKIDQGRRAFAKFPLLFTMATTFGLVATLYGFEGIIDRIPVLKENPVILLATGIATLLLTGSLYKVLSQ